MTLCCECKYWDVDHEDPLWGVCTDKQSKYHGKRVNWKNECDVDTE